jgi:hypothetical protein
MSAAKRFAATKFSVSTTIAAIFRDTELFWNTRESLSRVEIKNSGK